jgi:uncharacterized delta-60 repeat protein
MMMMITERKSIIPIFGLLFSLLAASAGQAIAPGDLDLTFGDGGVVTIDFEASQLDFGYGGVLVLSDDTVVVIGQSWAADTIKDFALARYMADGSLDPGFGNDGRVTTDFGSTEMAYGAAEDPSGKIVVVGMAGNGTRFALARYNADGALDPSFDGDGRVSTSFGSSSYARSVTIDGNGGMLVAGDTYQSGTGFDFTLARYNPNGSLDTTFGINGVVTSDYCHKIRLD